VQGRRRGWAGGYVSVAFHGLLNATIRHNIERLCAFNRKSLHQNRKYNQSIIDHSR
jgi:hypothetical protein